MYKPGEMRSEPLIKELIAAEPDAAFYTCDVRGIGESQPDTGIKKVSGTFFPSRKLSQKTGRG